MSMISAKGYAVQSATTPLAPFSFERRDPGPLDVVIQIEYCGVCHSDIHLTRNEWGGSNFPMVPGHEIIGRVTAVGSDVKKFKPGDRAGVGCMVDSCRTCANCADGEEQYCLGGTIFTYNSTDPKGGGRTYGGYSNVIVVDEAFALRVSPKLNPATAAPLLCAGITTYSPLRHCNAGPGKTVGVVGLGGLGHMAVQFARSFGAHVVQFTTSPSKQAEALRLGAHEVVILNDANAVARRAGSLDLIVDTVSAPHDLGALLLTLRRDGAMVLVGVPPKAPEVPPGALIFGRRSLAGSLIGGIRETQEMLDYCAEHGIASQIETIPIQKINEAYDRVLKSDVKFRFVIDMATL
jgi:alcohol dehydrogenase (NADP+)